MFRVEYTLHFWHKKGIASFVREEHLPFAPFIGLDVLDDSLGQFHLDHVAWHTGSQMFLCQATEKRIDWTLKKACRYMATAGWVEDEEGREEYAVTES